MKSDKDRPEQVTQLLARWRRKDQAAEAELFEIAMPELRKLAKYYMRGERPEHILQPTALLNEAYIKLVGARNVNWQNRSHFFAFAARVMRRILIDHGRKHRPVTFPVEEIAGLLRTDEASMELAITVDRLLEELEAENPEQSAVIELKFFLSLTDEEAAEALHLPLRTTQRRWVEGRRWMFERLQSEKLKSKEPGQT